MKHLGKFLVGACIILTIVFTVLMYLEMIKSGNSPF